MTQVPEDIKTTIHKLKVLETLFTELLIITSEKKGDEQGLKADVLQLLNTILEQLGPVQVVGDEPPDFSIPEDNPYQNYPLLFMIVSYVTLLEPHVKAVIPSQRLDFLHLALIWLRELVECHGVSKEIQNDKQQHS